ncbi:MAG: hypothetical protein H7A24_01280 [Leptospiraceae bacterium]|nr:hypothetical protein [Leptospiraceae bacterium]MCP5510485.1 hypothetical protein [Leptospiraceae bacterium]
MNIRINHLILINIFLLVLNCSSEQVVEQKPAPEPPPEPEKPSEEEILEGLRREFKNFEIVGFRGDQTISVPIYKKWKARYLKDFITNLDKIPSDYKLYVVGHADPHGGKRKTIRVANGRSVFIKKMLSKDLKGKSNRLAGKHYGSQRYQENKKRSSANRRVDFEIGK